MSATLRRVLLAVLVALLAVLLPGAAPGLAGTATTSAPEEPQVVVEYYYGEGCPVCAVTGPWLEDLAARTPGMRLVAVEVWEDDAGRARLQDALERYRVPAVGVPVVLVGKRAWVGFREGVHDVQIEAEVRAAWRTAVPTPPTSGCRRAPRAR